MTMWFLAASAWDARRQPGTGPAPQIAAEGYAIATGVAEIDVCGVIGSSDDWWWGRMCDPARLAAAIRAADADPAVTEIRLLVNSPGGSGGIMRDAHLALRACSKPTTAYIVDQALSAAYWIASGARRIVAHPLAMVGCVGTIVRGTTDMVRKTLRSSQTPDKAPEVEDDEWDRQWSALLDHATDLFLADIAAGRGWDADTGATAERVQRGATLSAQAALAAGLIDAIADTHASPASGTPSPPAFAGQPRAAGGAQPMEEEELTKVTEERDALAAKVAELEAELQSMRDEKAAKEEMPEQVAEAEAKAEAMAKRVTKLEAQLDDERRDRYIESRMLAGEIVPAQRKAVERLYALGGKELVEENYPRGNRALPTPVGHGQPAASGDATTPAARFNAAVDKVKAERKCSHDEASRYVQTAPEYADVVAALAAAMRRR